MFEYNAGKDGFKLSKFKYIPIIIKHLKINKRDVKKEIYELLVSTGFHKALRISKEQFKERIEQLSFEGEIVFDYINKKISKTRI